MSDLEPLSAIILAGGRSSRLGGAAKATLQVAGIGLLAGSIAAVRTAGCARITVAGPTVEGTGSVTWVREDPPFGGPVAGIAAALPTIDTEWVLVLACDLPFAAAAVPVLVEGARARLRARDRGGARDGPGDVDGVCMTDAGGRPQWLTAVYRTDALRRGLAALVDGARNAAVRTLAAGLTLHLLPDPDALTDDVDTWEDLERARLRAGAPEEESIVADKASRTLPPEALDDWAEALRERFALAPEDVPISLILDLARDVANGVARPAAPFSAFVVGLVAGRAGGTPEAVEEAVRAVTELAAGWSTES